MIESNCRKTSFNFRKRVVRVTAAAVLLSAASLASAQTTRSWIGTAGDFKLGTASNWSPSGTPSGTTQDTMQWDGTAATGNLQVTNASALDLNPGLNVNVTAAHTGSLTIVGTARLRLCTNSLTIANGAGAFSFGNGAGTTAFPIPLAGIGNGAVHAWTNNSAFTATINSEVYFLMGGGGGHTLALGGTGNWNVFANLKAQNSNAGLALTVNGPGTVNYAPTNAPGTAYNGAFNGITVSSGTFKFGNAAAAASGPLTVNGGTLDLNGFNITNNLNGAGSIDTTAVGGTPTLTVSNTGNSTVSGTIKNSAGTLSLVKMGPGALTLTGADTYSGTTTVSAGTLVANGSLGSGLVTVAGGAAFGGSATIGGSIDWQAGSAAVFSVTNSNGANALAMHVAGNLNLNNNSVTINVPGSIPLPIGTYTLVNATGGSSGQFATSITSANFTGAGVAVGTLSTISTSAGVATLSVTAAGVATTWMTDLAGGMDNWSVAANWSSNPYAPTNAGDTATLGVGSALSTITIDENISLGGITFTNPNSFILADAGRTLTFDSFGGGATVAVDSGTNSIATAISLKDKTTFNIAGTMALSLEGVVSGTSGANTLTKNGSGTLILAGNNTYGVAGSIGTLLKGGTLEITNSHALGVGDLTNTANAAMVFDTAVSLPNKCWVGSGSTLTLNDQGHAVALLGGLGGAGSLTKNGAGLDVITNNSTSTIATLAVYAGVLEIASNSTVLANGQCFVDNGSTLQVDSGATLNFTASGYGFIGNT
ncbi:MAG TPA: autotransporter-associated beta strand repeat-containing protein, partial [Verrucomicrobiae bacterium]